MLETHEETAVATYPVTLTDDDLHITDAARAKLAELVADADDPSLAVRVFVSGGGCGGMTYGMTFSDTRSRHDSVIEGAGFELRIDAVTLNYLRGAQIDFRDNGMQSTFVFNNVFRAVGGSGTCGACGSSGGGCH